LVDFVVAVGGMNAVRLPVARSAAQLSRFVVGASVKPNSTLLLRPAVAAVQSPVESTPSTFQTPQLLRMSEMQTTSIKFDSADFGSSKQLLVTVAGQPQEVYSMQMCQLACSTESHIGEVKVFTCSEALASKFARLFPAVDLTGLNVISIVFNTKNDMSSWNSEVESERRQLYAQFMEHAKLICAMISQLSEPNDQNLVDFIDPSTGSPYFARNSQDSLIETDDRFKNFGFNMLDMACCKVLTHREWASHIFVGTIMTTAPSELVTQVLHSLKMPGDLYDPSTLATSFKFQ